MDSQGLDSKAERIARYKAERRRQLAEKYGLSIDSDADSEYSSKYNRSRRDQDVTEKNEGESKDLSSLYSVRTETKEMRIAASESKAYSGHDGEPSPEREILHVKEDNERRAPEPSSSRHEISLGSENSTSFAFPSYDSSLSEVPSSPKQTRRVSLTSPKQLTSPSHSLSDNRLG